MEKISLLLLMFFLQFLGIAQESLTDNFDYKAVYKLTYQPDSTDVESARSELMVLYIGDTISRFSSRGHAIGDSLRANAKMGDRSMAAFQRLQSQIPTTEFQYNIFKHKPSEKIYYAERVARDNFIYEEDLPLMDWTIELETGEIAGYEVQKASTTFAGRKYIAWFTAEIPLPDGPYKFSGLPGLIVELSDEQNDYNFQLTNFEKLEPSPKISFDPAAHKLLEKPEFRTIKRNYDRNPLAALEQAGIKIHFTPKQEREAKKEFKEKLEKDNNPIELE